MNERKLDNVTGDIAADGGSVVRISDYRDSVLQTVKTYISTFQGECFTDRSSGVPYFKGILGNDVLFTDYAMQVLKEKILSVPGVSKVNSVKASIKGRSISGKFSLTLDNGERIVLEI